MDIRAKAEKQRRLLAQVESLGNRVTQKYVRTFQDRAVRALRAGGQVNVSADEVSGIVAELADLMVLGYVRRYRQEKNALGIELNLSFSREVKKMARGLELDLDGIRDSFTTIAGDRVGPSIASIEDRINRSLADITVRQQPTAVATKQLQRRLDEMGLSARRPSLVETLVRTHSQLSFNAAQYNLEKDDPEGLITGYVYSAVMDDRTRSEHAEMDGVKFAVDDPDLDKWWCPNGWNCRCQLVAITEPFEKVALPLGVAPDPGFEGNPGKLL